MSSLQMSAKKLTTVVVATALCLGTASTTYAGPAAGASASASADADAPIAKPYAFEAAAAKLRPHLLLRKDGTFALAPSAARAGVPTDMYTQVVDSMARINGLIRDGVLVARPDLSVGLVGAGGEVISVLAAGVNRVNIHWWGIEVRLDSTNANRVASALAGGSVVAALVGIFGNVSALVVAAVAGVGSAAIYYCNSSGTGVRIVKPYVGPAYCTAQ